MSRNSIHSHSPVICVEVAGPKSLQKMELSVQFLKANRISAEMKPHYITTVVVVQTGVFRYKNKFGVRQDSYQLILSVSRTDQTGGLQDNHMSATGPS
jgi:predicted restriction endonuclease